MTSRQSPDRDKDRVQWSGKVTSVQPRIRLIRSFDQRTHGYLGYALEVYGLVGGEERTFDIGIGKGAHAKYRFRVGDVISGKSKVVPAPRTEIVEYYKTSELKVVERAAESGILPPPWHGVPPGLEIYRQRGHRRLDPRTYEAKCKSCIWSCRMPVEIVVDHWNPSKKQYRSETFCYGPKSCSLYKAGPTRKVQGRKDMVWEESDWVDDDAVSHRGVDD